MKPLDGSIDPTLTPSQAADAAALSETALPQTAAASVSDVSRAAASHRAPAGYTPRELLGRGGMGEVMLASDERIGRDVAIKRMRSADPSPDLIERFLREAKIQARLDHPAIVPVHEIGRDADDRPYFTMKRLTGVTLHDVLIQDKLTQQKLLRAFADVCLAIQFAHERGVIHRDLKPANLMLGDYGEVYVLDWGVARVVGDKPGDDGPRHIGSFEGETVAGALLGTFGYMSPEQARGDEITTATDLYALGSILFEILTGELLHPRGPAAIESTLAGPQSPASRKPARSIPPELDEACVHALADDAAARPSARELADRVQQYLDGDRDIERRRTLAAEQLTLASAALTSNDPNQRGDAMRAAGRALALDPESIPAASLVGQLMLEPPRDLPPALDQQLHATDVEVVRRQSRLSALTMLAYLAFAPVMIWVGIRDWLPFIVVCSLIALLGATTWWLSWKQPYILWAVAGNAVMLLLLSRFFGPFVVVPGIACAATMSFLSQPPTLIRRPWIVVGSMVGAFLAPFVLEAAGMWAPTWEIAGGALISRPTALALDGRAAVVFLIVANVAMIVVFGLFSRALAGSRLDAHKKLEIQAWHLAQLLPDAPRPVTQSA